MELKLFICKIEFPFYCSILISAYSIGMANQIAKNHFKETNISDKEFICEELEIKENSVMRVIYDD
jgi:hypothetical protein